MIEEVVYDVFICWISSFLITIFFSFFSHLINLFIFAWGTAGHVESYFPD